MRFFLIGFMGAGKSFWGKQLAQRYRMPFVDLDEQIEQTYHTTIPEYFTQLGEAAFRTIEQEQLLAVCNNLEHGIIACGGGTPCFHNNLDFMNSAGTTLFLDTDINTLVARLTSETEHRPLLHPQTDLKKYITERLAQRLPVYMQAHWRIPETQQTFSYFDTIFAPYV